jgi:hypothetical protein
VALTAFVIEEADEVQDELAAGMWIGLVKFGAEINLFLGPGTVVARASGTSVAGNDSDATVLATYEGKRAPAAQPRRIRVSG